MSQEPAVLAAILGASLGVMGGVLFERVARSWGRLWCEPSGWDLRFWHHWTDESGLDRSMPSPEGEEGRAALANYEVRLDLFNGKEIPVGLRDARIVFRCVGEEDVISRPEDRSAERPRPYSPAGPPSEGRYDTLSVVNLPPRQWVVKDLRGVLHGEERIRSLSRWTRVEFVGECQRRGLFEGKTFRKTIATRPR